MKILTLCFVVLVLMTDAFAFNQDHLKKVKNKQNCIKCDLSGADLKFVKMNRLDLRGTNLKGSNLEGANFSNAKAFSTKFQKANLKNTNFGKARVFRGQFYKANISGADFRFANLEEAEFEYAKRKNVKWNYAKFCKTRFTFSKDNDFEGLKNEGCTGKYRIDASVYPRVKTQMDKLIDKWEELYPDCRGDSLLENKERKIACNKIYDVQDKLRGMNLCKGRYSLYNIPNAFMLLRKTWIPCRYKRLVDE